MSKVLSRECKILLQLLARDLFKSNESIKWEKVDLKALYEEAKVQTVIAIVFNALPSEVAKFDAETYANWQEISYRIMQRTLNNNLANARLTELLENNGIKHCTIKGYASACYYPNPTIRQMGDIDFLVLEPDIKKAKELLEANGFKARSSEHDFHFEFTKNKIVYEMHKDVTRVPKGKEYILDYLNDTIDTSKKVTSSCGQIIVPAHLNHGIVMLLHMQRHLINGEGIGLRHLCDWAVFVNSFTDEEWCVIFKSVLKEIGLWRFAQAVSKTAAVYLKMPTKKWFAKISDYLTENIMISILEGGNFGRKDPVQKEQQRMIWSQKHKNPFLRFIYGVNDRIYNWLPFFERCKVFLPIGYILYVFKTLYQIIFKGKNLNFINVYKQGNAQYEVFKELNLFEEE